MTGHRLNTDRKEAVVIAGCPNGCQTFELESEGKDGAVDRLVEQVLDHFDECTKCGESIEHLRREEPTEVLE